MCFNVLNIFKEMMLYIFRVLKDSFGNKLITSLKDHPWHIVYSLLCWYLIRLYYIFFLCVLIVLLRYAE